MTCKQLMTGVTAMLSLCAAAANPAGNDAELFGERGENEHRLAGIFPPGVKTIACISPAAYPGSPLHRRGVELLKKSGYRIKVMPHAFDPPEPGKPFAPLAGRLADFYAAWNDPEVDLILCIRGGAGALELVKGLDWKKLKPRRELYLQGYSAATQITSAMLCKGYGRPVSGPMCGSIAGLDPDCLREMKTMHHGGQVGPVPVTPMVPGDCAGLPLAGSLIQLSLIVESDHCPDTAGRIIFIERVAGSPEAVRKELHSLLDHGFFAKAKGVVFGHFLRCGDPAKVDAVLKEFAPKVGLPVYRGFPYGHSSRCYTIDLGRPVEIRNNTVTFPAVKK